MKRVLLIFVICLNIGCANSKYIYNDNEKILLSPVQTLTRSTSDIDYYTTEKDIEVGVNTNILVKFNDNSNLENYLSEFDLIQIKKISENLYLFQTTDKSLTIDISNSLHEKDDVKYAHPDFLKKMIKR